MKARTLKGPCEDCGGPGHHHTERGPFKDVNRVQTPVFFCEDCVRKLVPVPYSRDEEVYAEGLDAFDNFDTSTASMN